MDPTSSPITADTDRAPAASSDPGRHRRSPSEPGPVPGASFGLAVARFWRGYVDFGGRASRSEFLWARLFVFLLYLLTVAGTFALVAVIPDDRELVRVLNYVLLGFYAVGLLVVELPNLALTARRLADTGSPRLLLLLLLIPLGGVVVFVLCCRPPVPLRTWRPLLASTDPKS